MVLSDKDRRILQIYRQGRDEPATCTRALIRSIPLILGMFLICVVVGTLWAFMSGKAAFYVVAGVLMGFLMNLLTDLLDRVRRWRVLREIIDWQKVEEMLRNAPPPAHGSDGEALKKIST